MWIDINKRKPDTTGAHTCFGIVNKGSEHETKTRFTAYWQGEEWGFTDMDGEDLTGINESVKYWFDFSKVPDPKDTF